VGIFVPSGGGQFGQLMPLVTKKGRSIPNVVNDEPSAFFLQNADAHAIAPYAGTTCTLRRPITATYNCVGMIFASRRTCIDPVHLPDIFQDDEYRQLASEADLVVGDVVAYRYETPPNQHAHVALVVWTPHGDATAKTRLLSKWGDRAGEFFHDIDLIPPGCGGILEYWTDRP
jgi:hypothetical protein